MPQLPAGYAPPGSMPRFQPQPPIKAPPPLPPQGVTARPVIGAPASKTGLRAQAEIIAQPIVRVYNSLFG